MTRIPFHIFLVLILLISCTQHPQEKYGITEDAFVAIYSGILIAQQEGAIRGLDSLRIRHTTDSLYSAYHITRDQASEILNNYKSDLAGWKQFHEKVIQKLESMQEKVPIPIPDSIGRKRL